MSAAAALRTTGGTVRKLIDDKHRLICAVDNGCLKIAQCRYRY